MRQRFQIIIQGHVQETGFNLHVYRVAHKLNLTGWVRNVDEKVFIEIQGKLASRFLEALVINLPPLVTINHIQEKSLDVKTNEHLFNIFENSNNGY